MCSTKRTVIFPADKSEHSEYAWNFYLENVRKENDKVVVIHSPEYKTHTVADKDQHGLLQCTNEASQQLQETIENENTAVKSLRDKFQKKMDDANLEGEFAILHHGNPGEEIVEAVKQKEAEIVVMGTRGLGMMKRAIMGSVSDYVIHHSPVPVLVCRHK